MREEGPYGPLRRDVRLLGSLLGRVLVEQEGEGFLAAEERIRASSRLAREVGDPSAVREAVRRLSPRAQARMLRAFATYFQLANTAEQHHRIRRRRAYTEEVATPRESLVEAFELLAGVPAETRRRASRARLARARADGASDRGDAPDAPARACPDRGAPDPPGRSRPDLGRAGRARRRARRGDHDPLADRRGAERAPAGGRRDPPRALVLRGEPVRRRRAAAARVPAARTGTCRCRSRSGAGSAATSTATRRSGATRSSLRSSGRGRPLSRATGRTCSRSPTRLLPAGRSWVSPRSSRTRSRGTSASCRRSTGPSRWPRARRTGES